jgi:hypothetical protein
MVIRVLVDLYVIVCFTQTSLSPVTRGVNPAAMLVSANKHSWRRRHLCTLVVRLRSVNNLRHQLLGWAWFPKDMLFTSIKIISME